MNRKANMVLLFFAATLWLRCEYRTPLEFEESPKMRVEPSPTNEVGARTNSVNILVTLTDADNNVLSDTLTVHFRTQVGVVETYKLSSGSNAKGYRYYYPDSTDAVMYDTVTAVFYFNGESDSIQKSTVIKIVPRDLSVGYLNPHRIRVEARTDTVYKSGAGWKMLYHATVTDFLDNPVTDSALVLFSFEKGSVDTSLVSVGNLAWTGASRCVGDVCDSLPGDAITVLSYSSQAIGDTAIIRAQVSGTGIVAADTLVLPLPRADLHLFARNANLGDLIVEGYRADTAHVQVVLQDAFGVAVPSRRIDVTAKGGEMIPLCTKRDNSGAIIGTEPCDCRALPCNCFESPCECDTVHFDPCRIFYPGGQPGQADTLCDSLRSWGPYCDTLAYGNTGITGENGMFPVMIVVRKENQKDEETFYQDLELTFREEGNQGLEPDFELKIQVLFK